MEKQIYNLTSVFLRMNRFALFFWIAFPISLRFYFQPSDEFVRINLLLGSIGGTCMLAWLFAIGHRANEKLASLGINLNSFRFIKWFVLSIVVSYILILFVSNDVNTTVNGIQIHYLTPLILPIILSVSFLFTIFIAAKTLVSAELIKDAKFGEYLTTGLLMMIAVIGLWFIQPRVQKL